VVFDMFVYGKAGRKAPYAIKFLTQIQLSKLLINKKKNSSNSIIITSSSFLFFSDATHE
jgi:short-subunit dehydrogenase involved in D-alanine esterification of teichoic acids